MPQQIHSISISPDGKRAVVSCFDAEGYDLDEFIYSPSVYWQIGSDYLILVDLEEQKILAERKLPTSCLGISVTDSAVYYTPLQGRAVHKLSLDDMTSLQRVFVSGEPHGVHPLPNGLIGVSTNSGVTALREADLAETWIPGLPRESFERYAMHQYYIKDSAAYDTSPRQLLDSWFINGVVLSDPELSLNHILPTVVRQFPNITDQPDAEQPSLIADLHPWGRVAKNAGLFTRDGRQIKKWFASAAHLLTDYPLAAVIEIEDAQGQPLDWSTAWDPDRDRDELRTYKVVLNLRELIEGRVVSRREIKTVETAENIFAFNDGANAFGRYLVCSAKSKVLIAEGQDLWTFDVAELIPRPVGAPLRFLPWQNQHVAQAGDVANIQLKTADGQGKITYTLQAPTADANVDPDTGILTINTQLAWGRFLERNVADGEWQYRRERISDSGGLEGLRRDFQALTGNQTADVPLRIPFSVSARDERGLEDQFEGQLIVLGSIEEIEAITNANVDERKRAVELENRSRESSNAAEATPRASRTIDVLTTQLVFIEEQLREMQASSERLSQQIGEETESLTIMEDQLLQLRDRAENIEEQSSSASVWRLAAGSLLLVFCLIVGVFAIKGTVKSSNK